jgi:hypothetical protein
MWFCLAAYSLHVLEEFVFDWQNWARNVLNLPAQWSDFYITNAVVIVLGVVAAEVAPTWPAVALGFPALMLINATFFHVAPVIWTRGGAGTDEITTAENAARLQRQHGAGSIKGGRSTKHQRKSSPGSHSPLDHNPGDRT